MGVYANGRIMYGLIKTTETEFLFDFLDDGESDFEELYPDLREKYSIVLRSIGYAGLEILSAFSASVSAKSLDVQVIDAEALTKTEEYRQNIFDFLEAVGIEHPEQYTPRWYVLGYTD